MLVLITGISGHNCAAVTNPIRTGTAWYSMVQHGTFLSQHTMT